MLQYMCLLPMYAAACKICPDADVVLDCYAPLCREDAAKAIDKLDGYGYDNLNLRVEWHSLGQSDRSWH